MVMVRLPSAKCCNYQTGMLVLGIEGEGFWSSLQSRFSENEPPFSEVFAAENKWGFDVAARFGVAFDRALVYGHKWCCGNRGKRQRSGRLGLEYAFAPKLSAKFEADYLGFPSKEITIQPNRLGARRFLTRVNQRSRCSLRSA